MAIITIVGSGMMGSALAFPARENGNTVRLVGTHLDREIIEACKKTNRHPKFKKDFPAGVEYYQIESLDEALAGADLVIGDEYTQRLAGDCPVLSDDLFLTALDPENLCRGAETLAANLGSYPSGSRLLLNRVDFEPGLYPYLEGEPTATVREMYQKLWQNRGRC